MAAPAFVTVGTTVSVTAQISPSAAQATAALAWLPAPVTTPLSRTALYRWDDLGHFPVTVTASGCGEVVTGTWQAQVATRPTADLQISKRGPRLGIVGIPLVYTLTITNSGGSPAHNLLITDTLPAQSVHVSGGNLVGNSVRWLVPTLPGFGATHAVSFALLAGVDVVNDQYGVDAVTTSAIGTQPVTTTLVDVRATFTPTAPGVISFGSSDVLIRLDLPVGGVNTPATLGLRRREAPAHRIAEGYLLAGTVFQILGESGDDAVPLVLNGPATLQLGAGVHADLSTLFVAAWDGVSYNRTGINCMPEGETRQLRCSWLVPAQTEVVMLFPAPYTLYVPSLFAQAAQP
jgi:uncharacterized repeat protein (TIGR01451 family)